MSTDILRDLQVERWPMDKLTMYARNARTHSDEQVDQIVASMKEFGWVSPILASANGTIIAGHGRYTAARRLKLAEVPVIVIDGLTDTQRRALTLADNKLTLNSAWDTDMLAVEITALDEDGFDLDILGFDQDELDDIFGQDDAGAVSVGSTDADDAPEPPAIPISEVGDVWVMGKHRLMVGDSTSMDDAGKLMAKAKADMVFTDPPYGYSFESNHYKNGNPHGMLKNDDMILDFMPVAFAVMAKNAAIYICASHQTAHTWRELIDKHFDYKNLIVWKKNNWSMGDLKGAFAGQHELIFFAHKGRVELRGERSRDVWEFDRDPPEHHPTQKPVELVEFALSKTSDKGSVVLDLFGGSGTTLIACEKTGRVGRLMELDPKYADVIVTRWQDFTGKEATLDGDGRTFAEIAEERTTAAA